MGDEGLEVSPDSAEKAGVLYSEVTPEVTSEGIRSELEAIIANWGRLDAASRKAVLHLVKTCAGAGASDDSCNFRG